MKGFKSLALLAVAVCLGSVQIASAETLAIIGGTIVDATGNDPIRNGVLLADGARITSVGRARDVAVPEGARVIDARGKYLIPGLIDANLHLFLNIDSETLVKYAGRYHDIVIEAAQLTLKSGQTTVFDTWGPYEALVRARESINSGESTGSRIYLAGNIIGFDGPLSDDFRAAAAPHFSKSFVRRINEAWEQDVGRDLMWLGPDDVHSKVLEYARSDVDFLKYGASGHSEMFFISFSQRVQAAIVAAGHAEGKTVQAHTTSIESLDMAIEAGVDIVTHCDITGHVKAIPAETIRKLVDRSVACSVLPVTQARLDGLLEKDPLKGRGAELKISRENIGNLAEAGAMLMLSTDAGIEHPLLASEREDPVSVDPRTKLGEGHFNALMGLQEIGLAPMDILKTATSNPAKAYNLDADVGTLTAGRIADIVILNENPLKDARNYRAIHAVIKDGKIVDIEALPVTPIIGSIEVPEDDKQSKR